MRKFLFIILVCITTAGCQQAAVENSAQPDSLSVEVTRLVEPAPPSPTPIVCMPLPDDMTLDVEPKSESEAVIRLTGLQPGESLAFVFIAEIPGQRRSEIESFPVDTVGEDGDFEFSQTGLTPLDETAANRWEVKVVHARGAACTEITLP